MVHCPFLFFEYATSPQTFAFSLQNLALHSPCPLPGNIASDIRLEISALAILLSLSHSIDAWISGIRAGKEKSTDGSWMISLFLLTSTVNRFIAGHRHDRWD